jgi:hypothetical protein
MLNKLKSENAKCLMSSESLKDIWDIIYMIEQIIDNPTLKINFYQMIISLTSEQLLTLLGKQEYQFIEELDKNLSITCTANLSNS